MALTVPDIDTFDGLMHTLFALEDRIGLRAVECDGKPHLLVDPEFNKSSAAFSQAIIVWREKAAKLESGEITREDYDNWRYNYPHPVPGAAPTARIDAGTGTVTAKITPQMMSDELVTKPKRRKK